MATARSTRDQAMISEVGSDTWQILAAMARLAIVLSARVIAGLIKSAIGR